VKNDVVNLCSTLNFELNEIFNSVDAASETSQRLREKDIHEISDLEKGLKISTKINNDIFYTYSED
jgi:hypothetical protein